MRRSCFNFPFFCNVLTIWNWGLMPIRGRHGPLVGVSQNLLLKNSLGTTCSTPDFKMFERINLVTKLGEFKQRGGTNVHPQDLDLEPRRNIREFWEKSTGSPTTLSTGLPEGCSCFYNSLTRTIIYSQSPVCQCLSLLRPSIPNRFSGSLIA